MRSCRVTNGSDICCRTEGHDGDHEVLLPWGKTRPLGAAPAPEEDNRFAGSPTPLLSRLMNEAFGI